MIELEKHLRMFSHNNLYLIRYVRFIQACLISNIGYIGYTEKHHVLPKAKWLFPQYSNFQLHPWNCARLTPRQHFIAHWILSKVYTSPKQAASCLKALNRLTHTSPSQGLSKTFTSRQFDSARHANALAMRMCNPMHDEATRIKAIEAAKARWTSEQRHAQSIRRQGRNNITDSGLASLRERWVGINRPRKPGQQDNIRKSMSKGNWVTPFGEFFNPTEAASSVLNYAQLSRHLIQKYCLAREHGFSFIPRTQM